MRHPTPVPPSHLALAPTLRAEGAPITVLAWITDAHDPLNTFMASLTGHHRSAHGLVDVIVFVALGFVFMGAATAERMKSDRLVRLLIGPVVAAGLGLALWLILV